MAITPSQWSHVLTIPESYVPSVATNGQTLVITESVIAKLSAPDQSTFWSNVQNGGGDVRICTDSGGVNQLPVEVVGLDSVAETCVIWTRKSTYNGTGDLYVFIGSAGETQPSVTDPFGRNAVWSDFSLIIHEGATVDSTGNHAPVLNGSPSLNAGVFGLGYDLQLGNQYIKIPDSSDISFSGKSSYCVDVWSVIPALVAPAQMLVDKSYTSNNSEARLFKQNGGNSRHRNPSLSHPNLDTVDTYGKVRDSFIFNGGVRRTLSNDTQTGSGSVSGSISRSSDDLTIGSDRKDEATGGALPLKGVISDVWVQFDSIRSNDARSTEYANQSDPSTFFGTPTISLTSGELEPVAQPVSLITAEIKNEALTLPISEALSVNLLTGEHVTNGYVLNLVSSQVGNATISEERHQASMLTVEQTASQSVISIAAEHLSEAQILTPIQHLRLNSIVAQQAEQAVSASLSSIQALTFVVAEEIQNAAPLTVEQYTGQLITLIVAEQQEGAQTSLVSQVNKLDLVTAEQASDAQALSIKDLQKIKTIEVEQLTEAEILHVLLSGDNTDLTGLRLQPVTPIYSITPIANSYSLNKV